jgi:hypothetical protein
VTNEELFANAEKRVEGLRARMKAQSQLLIAMERRSIRSLSEAIEIAATCGIEEKELTPAREILSEEQEKDKAMKQLQEAADKIDKQALKAALEAARVANVADEQLAQYEAMLASLESIAACVDALKKAMEAKDVGKLRFHIPQAKEIGVDSALVAEAEAILAVEGPKHEARELLDQVVRVTPVVLDQLRAALQRGKDVGLLDADLARGVALVEQEEKRIASEADVTKQMEEAKDVDTTDIDEMREAKLKLNAAVVEAKANGVSEEFLRGPDLFRKKLHNMIEDLKGSIRVFCRVRPLSSKEIGQNDLSIINQRDSMTVSISQGLDKNFDFSFDACFTPGTQEEVFEDCQDLLQSAVDGYNVTFFAYGQTGSGKTFTMAGAPGVEGLAPRTISEIFRLIQVNADRFQFTVLGSMMELYRNDLIDLLQKPTKAGPVKVNVRLDKSGKVDVENLAEEECRDTDALSNLWDRGCKNRKVAATAMNSESSRSHLMFTVKIISRNLETQQQIKGKLMLIDLAGSERLKKSEVTGEAQKEAIEINKSLTALGDVMEALTKNSKQIPYRNHRLTQVMQDALGGTSKTLMFVNCSPASSNVDETVMSLKYATRAKKVTNTIGKTTTEKKDETGLDPAKLKERRSRGASSASAAV